MSLVVPVIFVETAIRIFARRSLRLDSTVPEASPNIQ